MSTPVAEILAVNGEAFARDVDGNMRALKAGDILNAGEVIVTAAGSSVELDFGNGETLMVGENQSVAMSEEMHSAMAPGAGEGEVFAPTAASVLDALASGGDLLDILDATAAGGGGGGAGGSEGGGFVALSRVSEQTSEVSYSVNAAARDNAPVFSEDVLPAEEESLLASIDDDITNGELPPADVDVPAVGIYASSGNPLPAWLNSGNTDQFNQYGIHYEGLGYGVAQNESGNGPDGIEHNETMLISLPESASEVTLSVNTLSGNAAKGTVTIYDADKNELGSIDIDGTGEYGFISDNGDIAYIVVNGGRAGNGQQDGFFVDFSASADVVNGEDVSLNNVEYTDVYIVPTESE